MMANRFSTKETLRANGIPPLIAEDISDLLWTYAQQTHQNQSDAADRILVHQKTIHYNDINYTIDYITTQIMGVWHQYKVIYVQDSVSPLPHTLDFRFETNEALSVPPPHVPSSSSSFRAAAYASAPSLLPAASQSHEVRAAAMAKLMSFQ